MTTKHISEGILFSGTDIPTAQEAEDTVIVITNLVKDKIGVVMRKDDTSVAHSLKEKHPRTRQAHWHCGKTM